MPVDRGSACCRDVPVVTPLLWTSPLAGRRYAPSWPRRWSGHGAIVLQVAWHRTCGRRGVEAWCYARCIHVQGSSLFGRERAPILVLGTTPWSFSSSWNTSARLFRSLRRSRRAHTGQTRHFWTGGAPIRAAPRPIEALTVTLAAACVTLGYRVTPDPCVPRGWQGGRMARAHRGLAMTALHAGSARERRQSVSTRS